MLKRFMDIANKATELVAHNGDNFDLKWLKGRCLVHGLVFPEVRTIDTCKQARSNFYLNSNALKYLADILDVQQKGDAGGMATWIGCVNGDDRCMRRMVRYCKRDVKVLEQVFDKMLPYITVKSHKAVKDGGFRVDCPNCGSANTRRNKKSASPAGLPRIQLQCQEMDCGKYFTLPESVYDNQIAKKRQAEREADENG